MEIFWTAVILALVVGGTILANRIMREMDRKGIPRGESLCAGNPNCPLKKKLEEAGEEETEQ